MNSDDSTKSILAERSEVSLVDIKDIRPSKKLLVIYCAKEEDIETLNSKIKDKIGQEIDVSKPELKNPRIKIVGVHGANSLEQLQRDFEEHNEGLNSNNFKIANNLEDSVGPREIRFLEHSER